MLKNKSLKLGFSIVKINTFQLGKQYHTHTFSTLWESVCVNYRRICAEAVKAKIFLLALCAIRLALYYRLQYFLHKQFMFHQFIRTKIQNRTYLGCATSTVAQLYELSVSLAI